MTDEEMIAEMNLTPVTEEKTVHKLAKLVISTIAGYYAGVLVSRAYDAAREKIQDDDPEIEPITPIEM